MILVVCIMVILWLAASQLQMQRALQWWYSRQSIQLFHQSDRIHNELLQDLFVIRRSLEQWHSDGTQLRTADWLTTADKIHHSLEQLSDVLMPPYVADSLPLALQALVKGWQVEHPQQCLKTQFPDQWHEGTPEQNQIILQVLDGLLRIVAPPSIALLSAHLSLTVHDNRKELTLQIVYPDATAVKAVMQTKELVYLRRAFQCLAPGRCSYHKHDLYVTWQLRWSTT